jgi:hypothetical protein
MRICLQKNNIIYYKKRGALPLHATTRKKMSAFLHLLTGVLDIRDGDEVPVVERHLQGPSRGFNYVCIDDVLRLDMVLDPDRDLAGGRSS